MKDHVEPCTDFMYCRHYILLFHLPTMMKADGTYSVLISCMEISRPLQSRFRCLHLPRYTEEQFLEVSAKVLSKLKIAHIIGKAVCHQRGDIRDVISLGKLIRFMTCLIKHTNEEKIRL